MAGPAHWMEIWATLITGEIAKYARILSFVRKRVQFVQKDIADHVEKKKNERFAIRRSMIVHLT